MFPWIDDYIIFFRGHKRLNIRIPCNIRLTFRSVIVQMALFWGIGLLLGTLYAAGLDLTFLSLMRRFFLYPVSIVIRLILAVLPILICTYAFTIGKTEIVMAVLFCKGFLFSFLALSAYLIFGSAGWLIQPMILFSDSLLMPVLLWFCFQNGKALMRNHFVCLGAALSPVLIHYFVVLPFGVQLIDQSLMGR